jgi:hypothetical protein
LIIPNQETFIFSYYEYKLPENLFSDNDFGDTLSISLTDKSGNTLPSWIQYNQQTKTISGIPNNVEILNIRVIAKDIFGITANVDYILDVKNSASDITEKETEGINIYPNPAGNELYIDMNKNSASIKYSISDITGKIKSSGFLNKGRNYINLEKLNSGIYFINIKTLERNTTQKFVKK